MCWTVAAGHCPITGEQRGAARQGEQEPQCVVHEPECNVEHDVVPIVEARRKAEIRDMPDIHDGYQRAPRLEDRGVPRATRKGRRAWVQVEQSYNGHVEPVQDHERGRKVIQLLC